ncbi:MAG: GNAT family N-acetyltransferase [Acidimicrobiales bacterium]|nr:GNAT family N-acetyltransferase [Acidimicrobiales bacterium]
MGERARLPELVEGDGLVLRRWTVDDAEVLDALVDDNAEHLRGYMVWAADLPLGLERRRAMLEEWDASWRSGGDVVHGIFDGEVAVGGCGLHRRIGPTGLEIGYWVSHRHLGRGLARRSSALLTSAAFALDDIDHVEIHHNETNVRSRLVPEQLGYRHVGEIERTRALAPAETQIEWVWRTVRAEWFARRGDRAAS